MSCLLRWLLAATLAAPLAAQPQLAPEHGNLEGTWRFRTDPAEVGEKEGWQGPEWSEQGWREIRVPGSWEAQGVTDPRPGQAPKPRGEMPYSDYDGVAWYRLHFLVPREWAGQELVLQLGSVDDQDRTFLNGRLLGETGPGLTRSVLVSRVYTVPAEAVRFGEENVLAVRVFDGGGPGGIDGPLLSLIPRHVAEAAMTLPQADRPLAARFALPPAGSRIIKIIHGWPDEPQAQDLLIQSLISQGFGGVVCNVSFTDYMRSEAKWQAFERGVKAAQAAGMSMWLYDEDTYPSGTAGGLTLEGHPEWQARGLLVAQATSEGGAVELPAPPGKLVSAEAFPLTAAGGLALDGRRDLTGQVREGKLQWQAPPGRWKIMLTTEDFLYEGTHSSVSVGDRRPDINLLMPEPTARFIEVTHEAYVKRLGGDLGRYFVSTFTDEPSLMSYFMRPMPYRVLPWAPNLPGEFRRRRGYALEPQVPLLFADSGGAERKLRYDFWLTIGELVSENFFGQIQEYCRGHNVLSGGHPLMEEGLLGHVCLYGDFFRCLRRLDAPSIDCLTSLPQEVPWYIARTVSSAAELQGRAITMCETSDHSQRYRPKGDERPVREVTEEEIRGTCNRLIVNGITTITSYYSFRGLGGPELRRLNDWVGRCSTMLTGGHQVTDLAVVYPIESAWVRFVPARHGATDAPAAAAVEHAYAAARDSLYATGRDFTFVDSRALSEAKVADGALTQGLLRWRVVLLPAVDTLPLKAWERLAEFVRSGGVVIALGALPANSESEFPCARVAALSREVFGASGEARTCTNGAGGGGIYLPPGAEALLPAVLASVLEPDVSCAESPARLHSTHRRIDGSEVFFVTNDSPQPWEGEVRLAVTGAGELWDPQTGKMTSLPEGDRVRLALPAYGGTLLRFPQARTPRRLPLVEGPLPGLTVQALPVVEPSAGKGEFVQAEVTADAERATAQAPAWKATGTLTKSNTDTFLFLGFNYPQGLDLSKCEYLALDSWVPEGQETATRLLVLVTEKDGGLYLLDTGRPLGQAGHVRSYVALSSLRPAGWKKDPDGRLDLSQIVTIAVGWGGYFGTEGERLQFTLAAPQGAVTAGR